MRLHYTHEKKSGCVNQSFASATTAEKERKKERKRGRERESVNAREKQIVVC